MSNTTQAPVVLVDTTDDGKAIVTVDGVETHLVAGTVAEVIDQAVQHIANDVATPYGGPVTVWATDPATGTSTLSIDQAGTVTPLADAPIPTAAAVVVDEAPEPVVKVQPEVAAPAAAPAAAPVDAARVISRAPEPTTAPVVSERREARRSFLTQEVIEEPATQGARGVLNKLGLRLPPGEQERIERERTYLVSQHFTGPRTIMFANGKGGAGKTMTTICLAAIFARFGGAGVLAWDNNQTRGTLGWSTEQARHDSSILDLLPHIDRLLGTGAQSADLAQFVHHQTRDRYDVLKSKPQVLATEQRFDDSTVDTIHALATKFYRLVFIDSGNDETDPMWLRAMDRTNQLVVPTTTDDKWAESAALLLEGLTARGGHYAEMSRNAVVVVGAEHDEVKPARLAHIADGFRGLAREVVTIPYDEGLKASIINYGALQPATQRAWLAAGAAVARGL